MESADLTDLAVQGYGRGRAGEAISRKSLYIKPVPQTDTGIRDEYSKARELNLLKELDKLTPYLRYKGCSGQPESQ